MNSPGARIDAFVDGTPGSNDMPGRLEFSTTADGAASPTERMRIDSSGNVYFGSFSNVASAGYNDKITSGNYELNIVASRSTSANRDIVFKGRSNTEAITNRQLGQAVGRHVNSAPTDTSNGAYYSKLVSGRQYR